jgi:hypothetical protein
VALTQNVLVAVQRGMFQIVMLVKQLYAKRLAAIAGQANNV